MDNLVTPATVKGRVITELMQETMNYVIALEKENAELREENEALKSDTMPPVLSQKWIGEYLGISTGKVSDWLISGKMPGIKKDGRWFVKREDFIQWFNNEPQLKLAKAR